MDPLGPGNAFWIDGEWLSFHDLYPEGDDYPCGVLGEWQRDPEICMRFPNGDPTLVPYFVSLLEIAESYHTETGRHLNVYGDLGELFGAIAYGIALHRNYAQGSDGRLGDDFVEIKTITPFKKCDAVSVRLDRHFSKLLVVRISEDFRVSGRMVDRSQLGMARGKNLTLTWAMLSEIQRSESC